MNAAEKRFVQTVWDYYRREGRHDLPWRKTKNPYRILVSEVMLQQTQVDRVLPKYRAFLERFPSIEELADASLGSVLREWQGLGYNRRAKMLHACAETVVRVHGSRFPKQHEALVALPGIGHYTAGALLAFAYNIPTPLIETNVRSAFMHHFFPDDTDVHDSAIMTLVERTIDQSNPREWYWALMDYGAYIKKTHGNPNGRSKHYAPQSAFKNSDRQIRGAILRSLTACNASRVALHRILSFDYGRIDAQIERLLEEGLIVKRGRVYALPD